ncbi:hypothetical protein [Leifsonia xyli]|uniref:hypothetical protein n=1 Tax=Leifsonia xyli TaxID=1575 RepID=UPI002E7FC9BE|nr:hypothetical protein [Leifsonia xyli]
MSTDWEAWFASRVDAWRRCRPYSSRAAAITAASASESWAAAGVGAVEPVADRRALKGCADEAAEIDAAGDVAAVHEDQREGAAAVAQGQQFPCVGELALRREEVLRARGVPRREVSAVADVGGREGGRVVLSAHAQEEVARQRTVSEFEGHQ